MLPNDYKARKALPLYTYLTQYHPEALLELVKVAVAGNEQHNPGEPLHWAQGKSMDQLNTAMRHQFDHGMGKVYDESDDKLLAQAGVEGRVMHLAKAAWRLLAEITMLVRLREQGIDIEQCVRGTHEALAELADVAEHNEKAAAWANPIRAADFYQSFMAPDAQKAHDVGRQNIHPEARTEVLTGGSLKGFEDYVPVSDGVGLVSPMPLAPVGTGPLEPELPKRETKGTLQRCGCFGTCAGLTPNCPNYPAKDYANAHP